MSVGETHREGKKEKLPLAWMPHPWSSLVRTASQDSSRITSGLGLGGLIYFDLNEKKSPPASLPGHPSTLMPQPILHF